ncbi:MAG: hypothetical protein AB9880_10040 [Christensenellales bacterium]
MKRSYIKSDSNVENIKNYRISDSYISSDFESSAEYNFSILPEEYSVFSDVDGKFFVTHDTGQHQLLALCLNYLKKQLFSLYTLKGIIRVLPKLSITYDMDNAIVINWAYSLFRVFLNFEFEANNSYYGIVIQNEEDGIFTKAGRLNTKNFESIIEMVLTYVIDNM